MLSLCPFDISVGVGDFIIGLSQISSFLSFHLWQTWRFQFSYRKCSVPERQNNSFARLSRLHHTTYTLCPWIAPVRMDILLLVRHDFKQSSRKGIRRGTLKIVIEEVLYIVVDTGISSNDMKTPSHECYMTFRSLTKYNDNPQLIRLYTNLWPFSELDRLPNYERFPKNICNGCGMPTGDTYSSGHPASSHEGLAYVLLVKTTPFSRTCRSFPGLCSSNIPRYFLEFALLH